MVAQGARPVPLPDLAGDLVHLCEGSRALDRGLHGSVKHRSRSLLEPRQSRGRSQSYPLQKAKRHRLEKRSRLTPDRRYDVWEAFSVSQTSSISTALRLATGGRWRFGLRSFSRRSPFPALDPSLDPAGVSISNVGNGVSTSLVRHKEVKPLQGHFKKE